MSNEEKRNISMPISVYNQDITNAQYTGQKLIINMVNDFMNNKGANVELGENATKDLVDFVASVKEKLGLADATSTTNS